MIKSDRISKIKPEARGREEPFTSLRGVFFSLKPEILFDRNRPEYLAPLRERDFVDKEGAGGIIGNSLRNKQSLRSINAY
jgi:hypothetical protein